MRILFYINQIYEGGAERVITQLASSFAEAGDEAVLVTSFEHEGEYSLSDKVVRLSLEKEQLQQSRIKRNVSRISKLRRIVKVQRPDIVLSFMQEPNFRLLLATIGLPCKKVVSVRNDPAREYAGTAGRFVGKTLMPLLADGCVFQTHQAMEWFPNRLQRKSEVIPNAVSSTFFKTERSGADAYWVAAGRLVEQKNYPMMLGAFSKVVENYPDERLRIYGEGPLRGELAHRIEELGLSSNVLLCGQTHDVAAVLSDAKGFLMTSDYEGMPNALMEAMAVGLPCVATDCPCGGPRELIRDGESGFLVPVGKEKTFAEKVIVLIQDKKINAMVETRASKTMATYSPEKVFARWAGYMQGLCGADC
mgnify:CR=1 FL=1